MPPVFTPSAPQLGTQDHPYFVGLAQLRSLLTHEDIAQDEEKTNAVLDVIGLLLRQAPAQPTVKAFCRMRRVCGPACYLALYRMRRWLEDQVMVQVGGGEWHSLKLRFVEFRKVVQDYSRTEWETNLDSPSPAEVPVTFCWRGLSASELDLGLVRQAAG